MKSFGLIGIHFALLQLTSIHAHPLSQDSTLLVTNATGTIDVAGTQSTPLQNVTLHFMKRPGSGADGAADGAADGEAGEAGESGGDGEDGESGEGGDGPFDDISDWFHDLDPPKPGPGEGGRPIDVSDGDEEWNEWNHGQQVQGSSSSQQQSGHSGQDTTVAEPPNSPQPNGQPRPWEVDDGHGNHYLIVPAKPNGNSNGQQGETGTPGSGPNSGPETSGNEQSTDLVAVDQQTGHVYILPRPDSNSQTSSNSHQHTGDDGQQHTGTGSATQQQALNDDAPHAKPADPTVEYNENTWALVPYSQIATIQEADGHEWKPHWALVPYHSSQTSTGEQTEWDPHWAVVPYQVSQAVQEQLEWALVVYGHNFEDALLPAESEPFYWNPEAAAAETEVVESPCRGKCTAKAAKKVKKIARKQKEKEPVWKSTRNWLINQLFTWLINGASLPGGNDGGNHGGTEEGSGSGGSNSHGTIIFGNSTSNCSKDDGMPLEDHLANLNATCSTLVNSSDPIIRSHCLGFTDLYRRSTRNDTDIMPLLLQGLYNRCDAFSNGNRYRRIPAMCSAFCVLSGKDFEDVGFCRQAFQDPETWTESRAVEVVRTCGTTVNKELCDVEFGGGKGKKARWTVEKMGECQWKGTY